MNNAAKSPRQLQFNQSGAWKSAVNFDMAAVPIEFLSAAETLAALSGERTGMRVVVCEAKDGKVVSTNTVAMHWSRAKGWWIP